MFSKQVKPLLAAAVLGVCSTANAMESNPLADKMYLSVGLQGLGLGFGRVVNDDFSIRADINGYSYDTTQTESGTNYQADLSLRSVNFMVDYFPFASSGFRLTGGAGYFGSDLTLDARGPGTADIDGQTVTLTANDFVTAKIDFPTFAPYLGIGYGHSKGNKGLYFGADLGVYIGDFKSSLDVSANVRNAVGDAAVERERQALEDSVSSASFVPSLQFFVGYRF